jgi:hypothetical protein
MSSLEQWGLILVIIVIVIYFTGDSYTSEIKKQTKFDKVIEKLGVFFKGIGGVIMGIIGIIVILIWIVVWLGFFGIIPQGAKTDDRYFDEAHAPFYPLR